MLKDKILEAAQAVIEQQEGMPAKAESWRLVEVRRSRRHDFIASVTVSTAFYQFDIWVTCDLDTEEVECI